MKRILYLLLTVLLSSFVLTACGKKADDDSSKLVVVDGEPLDADGDEANSQTPTFEDVAEDEAPHEGMKRSRLTNEWVDEEIADQRPIAVMIPNEAACIPHYNISNADILYECNVEGRMTRLMAVFGDWEGLDRIGNIRSLRDYYAYWAFEWDAIICHFGGPFYIDEVINKSTTENINGTVAAEGIYFRSKDRKAPHNAYLSAEGIEKALSSYGYQRTYREGMADDYHYQFTHKNAPNTLSQYDDAVDATYIDLSGCYPLTRTYFEYNEDDGLYYRSQYLSGGTDGPHMDGATGEQLKFKNILIQNTYNETRDAKGYLIYQCHDTTRDGWFFTNGKGIHVTWEKTSDYGATRYYDDNGEEIVLNTGKTMVCIVQDGDSFTYK